MTKYSNSGIYQKSPRKIYKPISIKEIQNIVIEHNQKKLPLTPVAACTAFSGAQLGENLVDTSFLRNIKKVENYNNRVVITAQAGVTFDQINTVLYDYGKEIPVWPFSHKNATIAGNVATNLTSPRSGKYGFYENYVKKVSFIDGTGYFHEIIGSSSKETIKFLDKISDVANRFKKDTLAKDMLTCRKELRNVLGINLYALLCHDPVEIVTKLLVGSLGSLAILCEFQLEGINILPEKNRTMFLLYDDDLLKILSIALSIQHYSPLVVDFLDDKSVILTKQSLNDSRLQEGHMLLVEFDSLEGQNNVRNIIANHDNIKHYIKINSVKEQESFWKTRLKVHGLIKNKNFEKIYFNPVGGTTVEPRNIYCLLKHMEERAKKIGVDIFQYGHPSYGDIHMKWILEQDKEIAKKQANFLYQELYRITDYLNGYITGDPGIFMSRKDFLDKTWGKKLVSYMKEIKSIFDPNFILNSDVMFSNKKGFQENILGI